MRPLTELKQGEFGFIVDLRDGGVCEELLDHGCFPGEKVDILENRPEANHMVIAVNNHKYQIIKHKANTIITNVVSYEIHLN